MSVQYICDICKSEGVLGDAIVRVSWAEKVDTIDAQTQESRPLQGRPRTTRNVLDVCKPHLDTKVVEFIATNISFRVDIPTS